MPRACLSTVALQCRCRALPACTDDGLGCKQSASRTRWSRFQCAPPSARAARAARAARRPALTHTLHLVLQTTSQSNQVMPPWAVSMQHQLSLIHKT
eukprot:3753796-Rhodomonas_salina.1